MIAGQERGKTGVITRVMPQDNKVLVDGINLSKRHRRATQQARKGQIIEKAMPIHASNVQLADPSTGKPTRIKITRSKEGSRERVAVKSGKTIK